MNENVQTIKIDEDGRCVLLINFPDNSSLEESYGALLRVQDELNKWWRSNDKFFILAKSEDSLIDLKFEKIENVAPK